MIEMMNNISDIFRSKFGYHVSISATFNEENPEIKWTPLIRDLNQTKEGYYPLQKRDTYEQALADGIDEVFRILEQKIEQPNE